MEPQQPQGAPQEAGIVGPPPSSNAPDPATSTDTPETSAAPPPAASPADAPASADGPPAADTPEGSTTPDASSSSSPPSSSSSAGDESAFPAAGEGWDPTEQPPPDAALGAAAAWQPPDEGGAPTDPPPTAPDSAAAAAQDANPDATVSQSSFDVVASDGSTDRITPGYSSLGCPVCGAATVKTVNVQAATPTNTLRGETVNPGDQVTVCESCGTTIDAGDTDRFEQNARSGAFGESVQTAASGQSATLELEDERQAIDRERHALEDRLASLEDRERSLAEAEERITGDIGQPDEPATTAPATTAAPATTEGGNA